MNEYWQNSQSASTHRIESLFPRQKTLDGEDSLFKCMVHRISDADCTAQMKPNMYGTIRDPGFRVVLGSDWRIRFAVFAAVRDAWRRDVRHCSS